MKIYTLEELRKSEGTVMKFLIGKFDSGKLIVDNNLLQEAIKYHRKNSKSKLHKSPSKIRQTYYRCLVDLNNSTNNK